MYLSQQDAAWAAETMEKIKKKIKPVTERSRSKIPYTTVDGVFDDRSGSRDISWWTNGFWGGMMWQLYALTGDELYRETAEELERKLDAVLMRADGLDHDNGFKWLPTAVADYRLTKNPESRNRALLAANNLAGRFNLAGNFIRAWNDWGEDDHRGWAIIDSPAALLGLRGDEGPQISADRCGACQYGAAVFRERRRFRQSYRGI